MVIEECVGPGPKTADINLDVLQHDIHWKNCVILLEPGYENCHDYSAGCHFLVNLLGSYLSGVFQENLSTNKEEEVSLSCTSSGKGTLIMPQGSVSDRKSFPVPSLSPTGFQSWFQAISTSIFIEHRRGDALTSVQHL